MNIRTSQTKVQRLSGTNIIYRWNSQRGSWTVHKWPQYRGFLITPTGLEGGGPRPDSFRVNLPDPADPVPSTLEPVTWPAKILEDLLHFEELYKPILGTETDKGSCCIQSMLQIFTGED
jgi:hypothetical protein